jgi:hypothetical protein
MIDPLGWHRYIVSKPRHPDTNPTPRIIPKTAKALLCYCLQQKCNLLHNAGIGEPNYTVIHHVKMSPSKPQEHTEGLQVHLHSLLTWDVDASNKLSRSDRIIPGKNSDTNRTGGLMGPRATSGDLKKIKKISYTYRDANSKSSSPVA